MIRLLIADDHAIVRGGLVQMLSSDPDIRVCGEAATVEDVLEHVRTQRFDLVLLDMNMNGKGGVPLIERLRGSHPELPILVLSMYNDGPIVSRALNAGANGFVTKGSDISVLLEAIGRVAGGGQFIDPSLVLNVVFTRNAHGKALHETLSERERQVLAMIVDGHRLGDIADTLHVSAKTVSTHKMRIMQKLNVTTNADLIRYAALHRLGSDAGFPQGG